MVACILYAVLNLTIIVDIPYFLFTKERKQPRGRSKELTAGLGAFIMNISAPHANTARGQNEGEREEQ